MGKESPFTIVYRVAGEDPDEFTFDPTPQQPLPVLESVSEAGATSVTKSIAGSSKTGGGIAGRKKKTATKKKGATKKGAQLTTTTETSPKQASANRYLGAVSAAAPDLLDGLNSLNPDLRRTLLTSSFGAGVREDVNEVVGRLRPVVEDIRKGGQSVTVAFLDLDARVGRLPYVIEALNAAQPLFTFLDLQAPLPAGLLIPSDKFDSWARHRAGRKRISKEEREGFVDNLMFNDFYKYAKVVRQTSGVDYLVGITQYMIAIEEEDVYYWNYFSNAQRRVILASAYDLREYATKAGRPFEVAVTIVALAQLLAQLNKKIDYHVNRGCFFDENIDRVSVVKSLKKAEIEPDCLDKIEPKYRSAVEAMMTALRDYQRPAEATATPSKKKSQEKNRDDSYWLDQLNRLSEKLKKSGAT
jgi:hypothetical protein